MQHFFPLLHCDNKQLFKELEQAACKCFGFAEALSSRHLARSRQDCDSLTNSVCRQERGAAAVHEGPFQQQVPTQLGAVGETTTVAQGHTRCCHVPVVLLPHWPPELSAFPPSVKSCWLEVQHLHLAGPSCVGLLVPDNTVALKREPCCNAVLSCAGHTHRQVFGKGCFSEPGLVLLTGCQTCISSCQTPSLRLAGWCKVPLSLCFSTTASTRSSCLHPMPWEQCWCQKAARGSCLLLCSFAPFPYLGLAEENRSLL